MLLKDIEKCILPQIGTTVDFYQLLRRLSASSFSIVDVIEEFLARRLSPVALCTAIELSKFLFLEEDIGKILDDYRIKKKDNRLSVIDVADNLHIKQEVAAFGIDRGIIYAEEVLEGNRKRRLVLPDDLEKFKN